MKFFKKLILTLIFLTSLLPLAAADDNDSRTALNAINQLIIEKQYQSAWTLLHDKADKLSFSDMILKKTELSLLYYAKTNYHQMFAFKDLKNNEALADLRSQEGSFDFKLYDPAGALSLIIKEDPQKKEAYYWLAEYYHQIMTLYGEEWEKPQEEIRSLVIANFRMALALGMKSEEIFSKLAYTELLSGNWDTAIDNLTRALEYNPVNPAYFHDLAIAHLNRDNYSKALIYADKAIDLYNDPFYKADSSFLASTIALHLEDGKSAESYLIKGAAYSPEDYRFPDRLIRLYLNQSDFHKARLAAGDLFDLYPENPGNCSTIIQYFYNIGKLEETTIFFDTQLKAYQDKPEIQGNLYFHKAISSRHQGFHNEALNSLTKAEIEFGKVHSRDNPVFQAIEKMRAELSSTE